MEVIFHLCYSCCSRCCCCCCEPLSQAWEQDKGVVSRVKQTQHMRNNCRSHSKHRPFSLNAFIVFSCSPQVNGFSLLYVWTYPLSSNVREKLLFFFMYAPQRKTSHTEGQRTPLAIPISRVAYLYAKPRKNPPAKNSQFCDRQMTSCCHLISFLA